jgi:DNA polymerase-3 subunit beta
MKLTIDRNNLIRAVKLAKLAIPARANIPILSCALFEASNDGLAIHAANGDQWLSIYLEADVDKAGMVALAADRVAAIADKATADVLAITVDERHAARIAGKSIKATIFGLDATDFPRARTIGDGASVITCTSSDLLADIERVVAPVATVPTERHMLRGIHFAEHEGRLRLEAADGRRVHVMQTAIPCPSGLRAIIPDGTLRALREVLALGDDAILSFTDSLVRVECGRAQLVSKLVDFVYPNLGAFLTISTKPAFVAKRAELIAGIARVSIIADPTLNRVKLDAESDGIQLSARQKDAGECEAHVDATLAAGPFSVAGNHVFLADALKALTTEDVSAEVGETKDNAGKPARILVFRDGGFLALVMPQVGGE